MMNSFDSSIMDKSINISCLYLENKVETAFDMSDIHLFTEDSVLSTIGEFTSRVIDAIVEFIRDIKEKIQRKYLEFRTEYAIEKIKNEAQYYMKERVTVVDYYTEAKIRETYKNILNIYCKAAKEIVKAYPDEEKMMRISIKAQTTVSQLDRKFETYKKKEKRNGWEILDEMSKDRFINDLEKDIKRALNDIGDTLDDYCYDVDLYTEKKNETDDKRNNSVKKRGVSICQRFQKDISMLGKKCAKFFSDNRTSILVALSSVLAVTAVGVNVAAMKERKKVAKMADEQQALMRRLRR